MASATDFNIATTVETANAMTDVTTTLEAVGNNHEAEHRGTEMKATTTTIVAASNRENQQ